MALPPSTAADATTSRSGDIGRLARGGAKTAFPSEKNSEYAGTAGTGFDLHQT